ncbi:MAG: type VI secretion system tube protein Hcp [Planctomycetota bacterium]
MSDCWVQFSRIEGDSSDQGHEQWCDALGFSKQIERGQRGGVRPDGRGEAGAASHSGIVIRKLIDTASPQIISHCCHGAFLDEVRVDLIMHPPSDVNRLLARYQYNSVVIAKYDLEADASLPGSNAMIENVTMRYREMTVSVERIDAEGNTVGAWTEMAWSVPENRAR